MSQRKSLNQSRRVILVCGMHRSGTSATTRVLNLLGARLPGKLVPGGSGNELGHWETAEVIELHDRALWSAGVNVNAVFAIRPEWFGSAEAAAYVDEIAGFVDAHCSPGALLAIKDPRMARFIPLWSRALERLGIEPRFALPFRHPEEVARSLRRRQLEHFPDSVWPLGRGVLLWQRDVLTAEAATRGRLRTFIQFDALLGNWSPEAERMAGQLKLRWDRSPERDAEIAAFLQRDHKHENTGSFSESSPSITRVYDQMTACVDAPRAGAEVFDRAFAELRTASGLFEAYVAELEARLASAPGLRTEFPDFPPPAFVQPEDLREPRAGTRPSGRGGLMRLFTVRRG